MTQDIGLIFQWWLLWLAMGWLSLPLTLLWLGSLWDKGYGFAKALGLVTVGYMVWLGASFHWWPFGLPTLWIAFGIWGLVNLGITIKYQLVTGEIIKRYWGKWLRVEVFFLLALVSWSLIRGYQPEINGLEKFMDYGFVNSITKTKYFPPADMWFAGGAINYYYFGHYLSAITAMLSGISSAVTYNLLMATSFALAVSQSIALGSSLLQQHREQMADWLHKISYRWVTLGGLLTASLLAVRGNLHYGAYVLNRWLNGCWRLENSTYVDLKGNEVLYRCDLQLTNGWLYQLSQKLPDASKGYWYPDATRYIPFTIHEFPIYSYVVADLHAHMLNVPMVLMFLAGMIVVIRRQAIYWWEVAILGWLLGVFFMSNAWDLPIYLMVLGVSLAVLKLRQLQVKPMTIVGLGGLGLVASSWMYWYVVIKDLLRGAEEAAGNGTEAVLTIKPDILEIVVTQRLTWALLIATATLLWLIWEYIQKHRQELPKVWQLVVEVVPKVTLAAGLALLVSWPFTSNFEQIAEGVRTVTATSKFSKLVVLWGWDVWLLVSLGVMMILLGKTVVEKRVKVDKKKITQRFNLLNRYDWWVLSLYGIGFWLILIPEFVYVKDIYIDDYHRANTMFKLAYQSWILFALAGAYTIIRLVTLPIGWGWKNLGVKLAWVVVVGIGLVAIGKYPWQAIHSYYGEFVSYIINEDNQKVAASNYDTLNGEAWLKERSPDVYAVVEWLRTVPGQPVILEAVGDSYTEFNVVSAYTGNPTVEGWLVHEWLWRGAYDQPGRRAAEVEHIYTTKNWVDSKPMPAGEDPVPSAQTVLDIYNVKYVIVGDKEREKYPNLQEAKFSQIGEVVFESGNTRVYEISG
jgi:YYY domain-containing protein